MKGYIYICKMWYEGKSYYKIGRTTDLGKRELALKTANPFLVMIAKKVSLRHEKEEREIQRAIKNYHFDLEWYELNNEQYQAIFNDFQFQDYSEEERKENLRLANTIVKKRDTGRPGTDQQCHVFKKPRKLKNGKQVHRWYYYYIGNDGRQIQKACRGCKNRSEAETFIRKIQTLT